MAGSGSSFSKCPSYVPLVAVRGVRDLLLDLEREGSPAFAAFKRRWEHSALPALLYEATLPVPASLRACAAPHLQGAAAGAGLPPSGSEGAESGSCPDRKLCVRHLYAAATSFLAGMWGDEREAEGASPLVQVGAVFTLFCLYWGQPEHARLPIPLTPAGWKHLLHLCERAKFISREEAVDELRALQAEWEAARRFILAHGHLPPATPSGTSAAPFWERVASSTEAKQNSGPPSAPQQVVPVCEWPATAQTALDGDDSSHHGGEKLLQDTHGQFRQCILCLCKQRFGKHYGSNKYPGWQKLPEDALVCSSVSGAAARQGAAAAAAGRDFVHRPVL